ncbi:MAG: serine acetyltransferase [Candidatus Sumerlaeota bacterium]|nr:serine acetyltransferase [Candidatus Sumerlaeota bacterium]
MAGQNGRESPLKDLGADIARYRREERNVLVSQGFWALFVFRLGRRAFLSKSVLLRRVLLFAFGIAKKIVEMATGITIPFSVRIGGGFFLPHFGCIFIHDNSVIGKECAVYQGVTIGARGSKSEAPRLGDFVNVGAGAKVLGAITIGDHVDIGANAVVLKDVPSDSIAVGVPARVLPRAADKPGVFA